MVSSARCRSLCLALARSAVSTARSSPLPTRLLSSAARNMPRRLIRTVCALKASNPQVVRVRAAAAVTQIGANALILLTTKVTGSAAALEPIAPLVRDDTTILCLQNGLGSEEIARTALRGARRCPPRDHAIRRDFRNARRDQVHGRWLHRHRAASAERSHRRRFDRRGSATAAFHQNIAAEVWHKMVFNCVVNPITAMLGCEVGGIAQPGLDRLKQLVIDECVAVAADSRPDLRGRFHARDQRDLRALAQHRLHAAGPAARPPTEIDYMNGAVAALGSRAWMCPVRSTARSPPSSKRWKRRRVHCSQRKCSRRSRLRRDFASSLRAPPAEASFW